MLLLVMVNEISIVFVSELAVMPTRSYTDTIEHAIAIVRHFLGRGQYDRATVYDADRNPVFRANRWTVPNVELPEPVKPTMPIRVVPQGVNPYEFAARIGKAGKLADALHRYGITKADALLMDEAMWRLAAAGAGVTPPSSVTQMLAIEALARLEAAEVAVEPWHVIYYSEGPGTSRYECARFKSRAACDEYIRKYDNSLACWEVLVEAAAEVAA